MDCHFTSTYQQRLILTSCNFFIILNSIFQNIITSLQGGGIYSSSSNSNFLISQTFFYNNIAYQGGSFKIFNSGNISINSCCFFSSISTHEASSYHSEVLNYYNSFNNNTFLSISRCSPLLNQALYRVNNILGGNVFFLKNNISFCYLNNRAGLCVGSWYSFYSSYCTLSSNIQSLIYYFSSTNYIIGEIFNHNIINNSKTLDIDIIICVDNPFLICNSCIFKDNKLSILVGNFHASKGDCQFIYCIFDSNLFITTSIINFQNTFNLIHFNSFLCFGNNKLKISFNLNLKFNFKFLLFLYFIN